MDARGIRAFGSPRFRRALKSTAAQLLDEPLKIGSFYGHAVIARGGQGTVFLATGDDQALSRICIIKSFVDPGEETRSRAGRSLRSQLALLDKARDVPVPMFPRDDQVRPAPFVPDIIAWDLEATPAWVAQDYRGPNLRRALADGLISRSSRSIRDQRTDRVVRLGLLSQVASATEFLHLHGTIHRDLKPDNVLVERIETHHMLWESVTLCDFDLAKGQGQTTLTQTAAGMGTPGYSAPEQLWISARDATPASDVYAVGMLAVFLLTGREPRDATAGSDLTRPQLVRDVAEQLGSTRTWVEQALSFAPEARPSLDALHPRLFGLHASR